MNSNTEGAVAFSLICTIMASPWLCWLYSWEIDSVSGTEKLIMAAICFGIPCATIIAITIISLRYQERKRERAHGGYPQDRR